VVAWVPVVKALRRYGPVVGPIVVEKFRREAQPYWQAYQQARRIDGYVGAWGDEDGKHWVVLDADRRRIVAAFPPMTEPQRGLALEHLDPAHLQHHAETVIAKLGQAPERARDVLPTRRARDDDAGW
jgi:hypothetical protein